MSILSAIKGKISFVQQEVSNSNFLPFTGNKQAQRSSRSRRSGADSQAGDAYLSWCQKHWSEIHRESERNSLKAQEVDGLVTETVERLNRQNAALSQFVEELTSFTDLATNVGCVRHKITQLGGLCAELESMLVELEDTCDQLQQRKNKQEHDNQLFAYQQRKHLQLEQTKVQLARKHANNVQHYEQHVSSVLKERQQVFEEAFVQQMEQYKASGQVPGNLADLPVVSGSSPTCVDLADIVVEEDPSLLNEFLGDDGPDSVAANVDTITAPTDSTVDSTVTVPATTDSTITAPATTDSTITAPTDSTADSTITAPTDSTADSTVNAPATTDSTIVDSAMTDSLPDSTIAASITTDSTITGFTAPFTTDAVVSTISPGSNDELSDIPVTSDIV